MSPEPPRRPGSGTRAPIEETIAPGAVHEYRRPPSFHERDTAPPPSERRPPYSNRPPAEFVSPVVVPPAVPKAAPRPRVQTVLGMPAPPAPESVRPPEKAAHEEGDRDSVEVAADSMFNRYAEEKRRADELEAIVTALKTSPKVESDTESKEIRKQLQEAWDRERERANLRVKWEALALKLAGGVVVVIVAACGYGAWRIEQIEHKTETTDEQAKAQKAVIDGLPDRVTKLESYERAERVDGDCMWSQVRSAIKRSSGYDITTLPDSMVVHWGSEGTKPNLTWYPAEQCVSPGSTRPRPPGSLPAP